ncbi:SDR family NAD(P)-dependent oxidoreductase [Nocardioides sp.]|uniref:SDR family NAD(P)-dependent oxidoreductase n=1 Tax=Nocardioides sp. TaxID=35761 RepID=UPI002635E2D0|nr:SDR family NAD(P)-dependent oxidoreductase [Nocardioides sp.]MDI6910377.1 SDR family NAD(P)-dependent oxidoreductase [Nocardioides sp.]
MTTGSAGRMAVVTGASGRIGRHVVDRLIERGYAVQGLDLVAGPHTQVCDLADEEAVRAVVGDLPRLDLLVLCAGLSAIGAVDDHGLDTHRRVMDGTHFAAVGPLLAALPALRRARGRVVLVGSVAGFAPVLGRPAYVAAKHAVTGLFTALRPELAADGVRVVIVHPTFVTGGMGVADPAGSGGRTTTGAELTSEQVAQAIVEAAEGRRDVVLVGRTARLAWSVSRYAPRTYTRLMTRRLRAGTGENRE